jgi:hypothetical protein
MEQRKDAREFELTPAFEMRGNLAEVEAAITAQADLNAFVFFTEEDELTLLHLAVINEHLDSVQRLLQKGEVQVDKPSGSRGRTALFLAAELGRLHAMVLLLEHSADLNALADDDQSPLLVATANGHIEVAAWLREHGAKADREWMGLRADDIEPQQKQKAGKVQNQPTQRPLVRSSTSGSNRTFDSLFWSGDAPDSPQSQRATSVKYGRYRISSYLFDSVDTDRAWAGGVTGGRSSNAESVEGHNKEGHEEEAWAGPVRIDYAEIWAVLQMKVPSGELVFDSKKLIGRGASCKVYRAKLYGLLCAIKVLSSSFIAKGCKAEKQFVAEIEILTSCKHANICRMYASSMNGNHKCAVLELMDTSLEQRLIDSEYPPLSWKQRVYVALCMFRGVVALHSRRPVQIHRDIKTSNILLNGFKTSTLHPNCIAKIADFGTARAFDQLVSVSTAQPRASIATAGITHANLTQNVVGTYPYMANECEWSLASTSIQHHPTYACHFLALHGANHKI